MNYHFIRKWLSDRNIILEPSFVEAIKDLASTYKKIQRKFGFHLWCPRMLKTKFILLGKSFL